MSHIIQTFWNINNVLSLLIYVNDFYFPTLFYASIQHLFSFCG